MQNQINEFIASLQTIATDYSDPSIILQHMPVVRDHMDKVQIVLDNKEIAIAGLIGLFVIRRILKKRKKSQVRDVNMVMPAPYRGEDSSLADGHPLDAKLDANPADVQADVAPGKSRLRLPKRRSTSEDAIERMAAQTAPRTQSQAAPAAKRSADQQLADLGKVSIAARPVFSADEARMRVILQAALSERKTPLMIMARTALAAILEPGRDAVGPERAYALAALEGKSLDFGLFDRAGRLVAAIDLVDAKSAVSSISARAFVQHALALSGIPVVPVSIEDGPVEVSAKLAPYLAKLTGAPMTHVSPQAAAPIAQSASVQPIGAARPGRPGRPARPARPAAMAAE